jgi:hypothetical protein
MGAGTIMMLCYNFNILSKGCHMQSSSRITQIIKTAQTRETHFLRPLRGNLIRFSTLSQTTMMQMKMKMLIYLTVTALMMVLVNNYANG